MQNGLEIGAQRRLAQREGLQEGNQGIPLIQEKADIAFSMGLRERRTKELSGFLSLLARRMGLGQKHLDLQHAVDASCLPRRMQQAEKHLYGLVDVLLHEKPAGDEHLFPLLVTQWQVCVLPVAAANPMLHG